MFPYLKEGDIVFFKKYKKNKSILKNRQIVIFNHPLKNKRLIAFAGGLSFHLDYFGFKEVLLFL